MKEVLQITELGQAFNGTDVLRNVSFSLAAGERLAVLGPSGSGKTTLIRLIAGLEAPKHDDIAITGRSASRGRSFGCAGASRSRLGFPGTGPFPASLRA